MAIQQVTTGIIAEGAVTVADVADSTITGAKLAATTITGDKITVGSLAGNVFTANTITGDKIGQSAISSNNIVSVNASVASVGTLPKARLPSGSILQVVQTVDNHLATYGRGDYITYLETSITPISSSSKILVCVNFGAWSSGQAADCGIIMYRGTTPLGQGSGGSTNVTFIPFMNQGSGDAFSSSFMYLDSPSTTSATAYKFQQYGNSGSTFYYNRRGVGTDYACSSSVILMEVAE